MTLFIPDIVVEIVDKIDNIDDIIKLSLCNKELYYNIVNNKILISRNKNITNSIYDKIKLHLQTNDLEKSKNLKYALNWLLINKNINKSLYNIQCDFIEKISNNDIYISNTTLIDFIFFKNEISHLFSKSLLIEPLFFKIKKYINEHEFFIFLKFHIFDIYKNNFNLYKKILHNNIEFGKCNNFFCQIFDIFDCVNQTLFVNNLYSVFYKNNILYDPSKYENFNIMDAENGDIDSYCKNFYNGHLDYNSENINYLKNKYNF